METLGDGRVRRFDVTAAAVMAEGRRNVRAVDVELAEAAAGPVEAVMAATLPKAPSRARELCISATIFVAILGAIGIAVALF